MKTNRTITKTAKYHGISEQFIRDEMQKALDAAWNTTDEKTLKRQRELFPDGKPTLEKFIQKIAQLVSDS